MEEQIQSAKSELSSMSFKDLFYKYVRFLPLFIISVALSLVVAYVYLRYATLVYRSTGTMIIQDEKNSSGGNDRLDDIFSSDNKKNIQNEIEYIQSTKMTARVVKALNLNFTYLAKGKIKELNIYKSSPFIVEVFKIADSSSGFTLKIEFANENNFRINGDGPFTFGQVFTNQFGVFRLKRSNPGTISNEYKVIWNSTESVASSLASSLVVAPKQSTGILTLTLESTNPQYAADVINVLMDEYQKATIDDKNATLQQRLAFIDRELDTVAVQLDSITSREMAFLKANNIFAPEAQTTNYLSQIQTATEQRNLQQTLLTKAYQIEGDLISGKGTIPVPSSLGLDDPTLNKLVDAYNQAQLERKSLLENAPPGNVAIKQNQEIINELQRSIVKNLENIKGSYQAVIGTIQSNIGSAQSQLRLMPEKQQALSEIQRQSRSKQVIYISLLERREESAIELASTISDIKVLQDATPNTEPVKPNRRSAQLLAIVVGIILPVLFIFLLELLNDKVTTRNDIARLTATTILGEVGHSYGKNTLVVTNNNRSVVAEQFRIIRSNLQYVINHVQKPVVLVTSSFSGEGKSFISTNVGGVMALAGKKTIILEFDIRKPKILSQLNISKKPGLTNYLLGKAKAEDLPVPVEGVENLFVLPCGPVPPNPAELLLDPKLPELFSWLRENFDTVIMDTAPVGMVSDALTLSKFADCTLYIVRQGHTFKKQIGMIDEYYTQGKLPKISIVLNDVKLRTGYGYYGYGGYGYGYGSGYFDDEASQPSLFGKWFNWLDTKKWSKNKNKKTKV
ncbi:MAG TPA: polysaccharide biosynthesis tyrosine autokinase [Flavisolibacter sp.]|nr:polysaccharide biosynthesis tyrosine autokinase [Flavisolibacter sp.]